jgi:hypothetical protein
MKLTIAFLEKRLPFLLREINEDRITVVDEPNDMGMVDVELIIENAHDVLKIFHAGMEAGEADFV